MTWLQSLYRYRDWRYVFWWLSSRVLLFCLKISLKSFSSFLSIRFGNRISEKCYYIIVCEEQPARAIQTQCERRKVECEIEMMKNKIYRSLLDLTVSHERERERGTRMYKVVEMACIHSSKSSSTFLAMPSEQFEWKIQISLVLFIKLLGADSRCCSKRGKVERDEQSVSKSTQWKIQNDENEK